MVGHPLRQRPCPEGIPDLVVRTRRQMQGPSQQARSSTPTLCPSMSYLLCSLSPSSQQHLATDKTTPMERVRVRAATAVGGQRVTARHKCRVPWGRALARSTPSRKQNMKRTWARLGEETRGGELLQGVLLGRRDVRSACVYRESPPSILPSPFLTSLHLDVSVSSMCCMSCPLSISLIDDRSLWVN